MTNKNNNLSPGDRDRLQARFASLVVEQGLAQKEAAALCGISRKTACFWYKEMKLADRIRKKKEGARRDRDSANGLVMFIKKKYPQDYPLVENRFREYLQPY